MMNLEYYISEAISGRNYRSRKYDKFPSELDKDIIIDWLEYHGFKRVDTKGQLLIPGNYQSSGLGSAYNYSKKEDDLIYVVGKYDQNRPGTCWISFGNHVTVFTASTYTRDKTPSWWRPYSRDTIREASREYYDNSDEFYKAVEKYLPIK